MSSLPFWRLGAKGGESVGFAASYVVFGPVELRLFRLLWFVLVRPSIIWCKTYALYRTVVSLFYLVLITLCSCLSCLALALLQDLPCL